MKRSLSILLTISILLPLLASWSVLTAVATPADTTVYTEVDSLEEFVEALASKENIKLTADITLAKNTKYQLYTSTTLNGNGHALIIPEMDNDTNAPFAWAIDSEMDDPTATTTIKNVSFGSADQPFHHKNKTQKNIGLFTGIVTGYPTAWENVNVYYNVTTQCSAEIGAIMPNADGTHTFTNCNVFVEIDNRDKVTGAWIGTVGSAGKITMNQCNTFGHVTNIGHTASGFIGMLKGSLEMNGCENRANIATTATGADTYASAGFVAYGADTASMKLDHCINYGNIAGNVQAGGLLGYTFSDSKSTITLTDCVNYGNVKAFNGNAGGFAAQAPYTQFTRCINFGTCIGYNAAGFMGNVTGVTATDSLNAGTINCERMGNACAGGFFAYGCGATLTNCVNIGAVSQINGKSYGAGNFAGHQSRAMTLTNCYAFGKVSSHMSQDGVLRGVPSTAALTVNNCRYIDYGSNKTGLTEDCTYAMLNEAPALIKSLLGIDTVIGERNRLVVATPTLRGVQSTAPQNGKQSIRLLATFEKARTAFSEVGFDVAITVGNQPASTKTYSSTVVYLNINDVNGTITERISADMMYGEYIFAAELKDIPATDSDVTLTVTPWTSNGATKWKGETKTVVFKNGAYQSSTKNKADTTVDPITYGSPLFREANTPLYQKSVLFCGDSICFGTKDAGMYAPSRAWSGRLGYIHDMDYVNAGVSSASVSNERIAYSTIISQVEAHVGESFDYILLHGGVNDAWGTNGGPPAPLGSITPEGTTTFDLNTFAGGLENLLYKTKQYFPDAKIGYLINFYAPGATAGVVANMSSYVNMTILICEKYDIPYLNLYNNLELIQQMKVNSTADRMTYLPDNIHPNAGGYDLITPYVSKWMKEVLAA